MSGALFLPPEARRRQRQATRLLVVEDDPLFQALVQGWLGEGDEAFRLDVHGDLQSARRAIAGGRYDLVLLDLNLPDSRGLDTLRGLREGHEDLAVVVLTSEEDDAVGVKAVQEGAQDYLQKDQVDPEALRRQLRFALERRRLQEWQKQALQREMELERLQDLDQAKNRFYQAAARGLRDPLRPLRMGMQMIRLEAKGPQSQEYKDALTSVERHLDHLDKLVGDLVDFAAIQTGSLELERTSVDLGRLVRETVQDWEAVADGNRLSLASVADPDLVVDADAHRIRQVLDHLLENAVQATPGGGKIVLEAARAEGTACVRVRDSGVGVDPKKIPDLFEAFGDGEGDEGGTRGLGLAFCRGVVEAHGGSLRLTSEGPGTGVTAQVDLPLFGELG